MTEKEMFHWPIIGREDEEAVLEVLRSGNMSGTDITQLFEKEFASWMGVKYALGTCNGTASLQESYYACGVGPGTEVICPSMTYWASAAPAVSLGAEVVFADIEKDTLCLDPEDIEHRINEKTRAIMVVHYGGHPADMDKINAVAKRHNVKVIEDVSHAQGSLYKGRMCGTLGDIAGISMMGGKSFAVGEGGMMVTNDRKLYEKCMLFGHYERLAFSRYSKPSQELTQEELRKYIGVPVGGVKHRMNQTCSAFGRVQLKSYPARIAEIDRAMNCFWNLLEGEKFIRPHRVDKNSGSTMGGWYAARGLYCGKNCEKFCEKVREYGFEGCFPGGNMPLHLHPFFAERRAPEKLPVSESINDIAFSIPWFKHYDPEFIGRYAEIFKKASREVNG